MLEKFYVILAVAGFIKNPNNEILIVKKAEGEKVDGGLWTVPGGKIDPQEEIIDGLKRELYEEVGLEISGYKWIGEDVFESNKYWYHGQHFLCTVDTSSAVILEKNLTEYKWISKKEIESYQFHPNIKKRLLEILS